MSEQARQRIAQLSDFRARKAAMDVLVEMGVDAVPALVEALGYPAENVRWAVRSVLARLGGEAVTAALLAALDDPARRDAAAQTLREMTGQSFGTHRQAWARHFGGPAAAGAPAAAALTDEALVNATVEGTGIPAEWRGGGAVLRVPLDGGRTQRVTVSFAAKDSDGEPLVVAYTECGPAEPKNHEWALRQNLKLAFGALAIRDRDGEPTFVMVNTHLRATVTPEDLRRSVRLLARKGDAIEKALTTGDAR